MRSVLLVEEKRFERQEILAKRVRRGGGEGSNSIASYALITKNVHLSMGLGFRTALFALARFTGKRASDFSFWGGAMTFIKMLTMGGQKYHGRTTPLGNGFSHHGLIKGCPLDLRFFVGLIRIV